MFSGIVERACPVVAVEEREGGRRVSLDLSPLRSAGASGEEGRPDPPGPSSGPLVRLGDSVAVRGVCLTVAALRGDVAAFDVVPETLGRTNLGHLAAGEFVNVERALRYGDRVDGHLVQGHVERSGEVAALRRPPGEVRLTVRCGREFARQLLPKGSVAVDGVSLTVAELHEDAFTVALVPHTLQRTTLAGLREKDLVNLEPDLLGQWVLAAVARQQQRD